MDELAKKARAELEPPWDDVREARVLARVQAHESAARGRSWWPLLLVATSGAVALALALLLVRGRFDSTERERVAVPAPTVTPVASSGADVSVLALADGSKAHLRPGAEVRALEQSASHVSLLQLTGEVRYDVRPDPQRPFTVLARGVEVRVIGTLFTVSVEPGGVGVNVEHGRVSVKNGSRAVELTAGERLRLSSSEVVEAPAAGPPTSARPEPSSQPAPGEPAGERAPETAAVWLARADQARAVGDLATAEHALKRVVSEYSTDPKAMSAAFSLGRVQSARGNFAAAARTFEALRKRLPGGPLAEDALAEAANAWALAGSTGQARALASEYLARYPQGPHAGRMRRLGSP